MDIAAVDSLSPKVAQDCHLRAGCHIAGCSGNELQEPCTQPTQGPKFKQTLYFLISVEGPWSMTIQDYRNTTPRCLACESTHCQSPGQPLVFPAPSPYIWNGVS